MCSWPTCRWVSCLWTICGSSEAASFITPATLLLCWITPWTDEGSGLFISAGSRVLIDRRSRIFSTFCLVILLTFPNSSSRHSVHSQRFVAPAEILFGGVYIWGNPQLCFPDPQSINWRDIMDQRNTDTRHRLQPRAQNCERQDNKHTPSACFTIQHIWYSVSTTYPLLGSEHTQLSVVWTLKFSKRWQRSQRCWLEALVTRGVPPLPSFCLLVLLTP